MAVKKRYCVRVVLMCQPDGPRVEPVPNLYYNEQTGSLIKALANTGLVTVHEVDPRGLTALCFDIECPRCFINSQTHSWSTSLAEKLTGLGFNAVVAPTTKAF